MIIKTTSSHRLQKLEEDVYGIQKKEKVGKSEKNTDNLENIEVTGVNLVQDMSDPFEDFPHTPPFDCVNVSQRCQNLELGVFSNHLTNSVSHPEAWTFVCVNHPDFNDIAREIYHKKVL